MLIDVFADATLAAPLSCLLGVAIKKEREGRHIGILLNHDGVGKLLDLAWHKLVRFEPVESAYFWLPSGLSYEDVLVLSEALVAAASQQPLPIIPYSSLYSGAYFLENSLQYERNQPGEGLTCATFVLAVFDAFGYHLLDAHEWPAREGDEEWRNTVIETLRRHPKNSTESEIEAHIDEMLKDPVAFRLRPEEVAASVAATAFPMAFNDSARAGNEILRRI